MNIWFKAIFLTSLIEPFKQPFREPLALKLYSLMKGVWGSLGASGLRAEGH